jgi:hypothetical protein
MALTQVASGLIASVSGASLTGTQNIPKATLPTGSVLQVVQTVNTTRYSGATGSEAYISGLTASITPTSSTSKILIYFQISTGLVDTSVSSFNAAASYGVRRGTTTAATLVSQARCGGYAAGTQVEWYGMTTFVALDSPASSSAVTYGIFVTNIDGNPSYVVNDSSGISNFVLTEIAA